MHLTGHEYLAPMAMPLIEALAMSAREARKKAGLKQSRIAATLDVDQSTVARFEKGSWPQDPEAMILAYAEETGVSARKLITRALDLWEGDP